MSISHLMTFITELLRILSVECIVASVFINQRKQFTNRLINNNINLFLRKGEDDHGYRQLRENRMVYSDLQLQMCLPTHCLDSFPLSFNFQTLWISTISQVNEIISLEFYDNVITTKNALFFWRSKPLARGRTDRDNHGDHYTHMKALGIIITTE